MRLIDADARIDDLMERCCKECDKRKGIKNGKRQFIYEIGGAPCRACEVDDIKAELEEAPSIDAVPVVRCRECKNMYEDVGGTVCVYGAFVDCITPNDFYCAFGERREDD